MPAASSDFDAPRWTCDPSGIRSSTIRLASAAPAARRTVIPFASSAAGGRLTGASPASVPNRLLSDGSWPGSSSVIIWLLLGFRSYTCTCKYIASREFIAYASTGRIRRRRPRRPDDGERAARPAWSGGVGGAATGTRHAAAPARDGSREGDGPGVGRF